MPTGTYVSRFGLQAFVISVIKVARKGALPLVHHDFFLREQTESGKYFGPSPFSFSFILSSVVPYQRTRLTLFHSFLPFCSSQHRNFREEGCCWPL